MKPNLWLNVLLSCATAAFVGALVMLYRIDTTLAERDPLYFKPIKESLDAEHSAMTSMLDQCRTLLTLASDLEGNDKIILTNQGEIMKRLGGIDSTLLTQEGVLKLHEQENASLNSVEMRRLDDLYNLMEFRIRSGDPKAQFAGPEATKHAHY